MDKKNQKKYKTFSCPHTVNIFHVYTSYQFLHISCGNCKMRTKCAPNNHKHEICEVAHETNKLLGSFTFGHVSSFLSDDFYVKTRKRKRNHKCDFENALFHLWSKYAEKTK